MHDGLSDDAFKNGQGVAHGYGTDRSQARSPSLQHGLHLV
jgi:hypothetical protein